MNKKNIAVWDFNGSVVDDVEAHLRAKNAVLELFDKPPVESIEDVRRIVSVPYIAGFERLGISRDDFLARIDEIDPLYHRVYLESEAAFRLRDGVLETLEMVRAIGGTNVILSNTQPEALHHQMDALGITSYFDWHSPSADRTGIVTKLNKTQRLRTLLDEFATYASLEGCVIGDSTEEPQIGRDLGMTSIALNGGWFDRERLAAAQPDYHVDSVRDIPAILQQVWTIRPRQPRP